MSIDATLTGSGWSVEPLIANPLHATVNADGQTVLDDASKGPVIAAASVSSGYRIVVLGDSIPEGQVASYPMAEADIGWWYSSTITPAAASFLRAANYDSTCASNETGTIEWDGVSRMRAAIAGDSAGAWVDITGGGFFALTSGTNGKKLFVQIRWRNRATMAAGTVTVTNTGNTYAWGRCALSGLFTGGLLRSGLMIGNRVKNFAIGGDAPTDILNRIGQVIADAPHAVLLMCGVNLLSEAATVIPQIVARLASAGIRVILSPTLPRNTASATDVANLDAAIAACRALANGSMVQVVDLSAPMRNPQNATGAIECASQYNVDELHPSLVGTCQRLADVLDPVLRQAFPGAGRPRLINASSTYNAASNPRGNLLGANAIAAGTTGALGASPTPTGNLPTNWSDLSGGGTAQASVVYTCKASGSPIPRGDKPGAFWDMQQVIVAGAGTGYRVVRIPLEAVPTVGARYRFRCVLQLLSVTNLTEFQIDLRTNGFTAPRPRILQVGTLPLAANTIDDTGILYFESEDVVVPTGTTSIEIQFTIGLAASGASTLRVAELDFMPA